MLFLVLDSSRVQQQRKLPTRAFLTGCSFTVVSKSNPTPFAVRKEKEALVPAASLSTQPSQVGCVIRTGLTTNPGPGPALPTFNRTSTAIVILSATSSSPQNPGYPCYGSGQNCRTIGLASSPRSDPFVHTRTRSLSQFVTWPYAAHTLPTCRHL